MSERGEIARRAMLRRELVRWQTVCDRVRHDLNRASARAVYYKAQLAALDNVPRVLEAAE